MTESNVIIIAAVSDNGVIGKDNSIPWKQSTDMKNFKYVTTNNVVIMGARTFDSLNRKPLLNRTNIVMTRNIDKYTSINGDQPVTFFTTFKDSLDWAFKIAKNELDVFIIGGETVYKQAINLPIVKTLLITKIHTNIDGDAHFPHIDDSWKLMSVVNFPADENNQYPYSFCRYER